MSEIEGNTIINSLDIAYGSFRVGAGKQISSNLDRISTLALLLVSSTYEIKDKVWLIKCSVHHLTAP